MEHAYLDTNNVKGFGKGAYIHPSDDKPLVLSTASKPFLELLLMALSL